MLEILYGTVLFVAVAIVIGTGVRIVEWITGGSSEAIWKVALALVLGAGAGATALIGLRNGS